MSHPRRLRIASLVLALVGFLVFGVDNALAIPYFNGPGGFGFDNSELDLSPKYLIESPDEFHAAGSIELNTGDFEIVLDVEQEITVRNDSFVVDVTWRVRNKLDETIDNVLVLFTALDGPPDFPDYSGAAPFELTKRNGNPFPIAVYESAGTDYYFAGFSIKDLEHGKQNARERHFRYVVDGSILDGRTPALGVAAVFDPKVVPEPGTLPLMGAGVLAVAGLLRRRRCDS